MSSAAAQSTPLTPGGRVGPAGPPLSRVEGRLKVTGQALYTAEVRAAPAGARRAGAE